VLIHCGGMENGIHNDSAKEVSRDSRNRNLFGKGERKDRLLGRQDQEKEGGEKKLFEALSISRGRKLESATKKNREDYELHEPQRKDDKRTRDP